MNDELSDAKATELQEVLRKAARATRRIKPQHPIRHGIDLKLDDAGQPRRTGPRSPRKTRLPATASPSMSNPLSLLGMPSTAPSDDTRDEPSRHDGPPSAPP